MEAKVYKVAIGTESFSSTVDFAVENPDIGSTVTSGWRNSSLHVATIGGNKVFIENILQYSDVFTTNSKGETALHIAARLGHVEVATCLIEHVESLPRQEEDPDWLTMVNQEGNTALHEAVRYGHFAMVELLIRKRPLLASSTNGDGESPLFMAVDRKFYRIARHILEKFPNCSDSGRNGMNVMHAAVIRLHYISFRFYSLVQNFVKDVLDKFGPNILEVKDNFGWAPLHYAARVGNEKVLGLFLERNKSLACIKDNKGMSALHIAAENGRNYVVSILVQICPDCCELQDNRGWTALHVAVEAGHLNVVTNLLHKKPFNYLINEKDDQGNTVLHLAAIHGRYLILRRLASDKRLDKGAINKDGMTVVDIIQTSTELYHDKKLSLTTMLKERGLQPSLERRFVLREKRTDEQTDNKELKENEIIQETDDQETSKQLAKNKRVVGAAAASHGASSSSMTSNEKRKEKGLEIKRKKKYYGWSPELVKNFANVNLLVATIIASITFAAAMTMPGGYDSSAGMAVLRTKSSFKLFLIFDSLAFSCSSASMCIHFLVAFTARFNIDKYSYSISAVVLLTLLSIVSTVISFIMGTDAVLSYRKGGHGLSAKVAIISFTVPVSYFFLRLVVVLFKRLHLYIGNRK